MSDLSLPGRSWRASAVQTLQRLIGPQLFDGRIAETLAHCNRVADELADRTARLDLAQAGFLHAIDTSWLPEICAGLPRGFLADQVENILVDRQRLRDIDEALFRGADASNQQHRRVLNSVLARIRSGAAIVLLIVEQLDHLDPTSVGRNWLRTFYRDLRSVGPVPRLMFHPGKVDKEALLSFAETVIPFVADYLALREERRFARDLVALHRDRTSVERIIAALIEHQPLVEPAYAPLQKMLKASSADIHDLRWDWRHIRSCQLELGTDQATWSTRVWGCGFVTIVAATRDEAYRVLGLLHEHGTAEQSMFRDYFSSHKNDAYRALHTAIYATLSQTEILLRVRIVTRELEQIPTDEGMRNLAKQDRRLFDDLVPPENSIIVFTPSHDVKYLPKEAVVLNFAAALNSGWIARVEGAQINDQFTTDAMWQLQHRDTVTLKLRDTPAFLRKGWSDSLPESSRRSLRDYYAAAVAPLIMEAGRTRIREALNDGNIYDVPDQEIDSLVEAAVTLERSQRLLSRRYSARDCLRQLGMSYLRAKHSEHDVPGGEAFPEYRLQQLIQHIVQVAQPVPELDIPPDLRKRITDIVSCSLCSATLDFPVVGVEHEGVLTVHFPDCTEAQHSFPLKVHRRVATRQYVALETTNRQGVLAEICTLLRRRNVDIIDIAGRRRSPRWAAVRLELDCPGGAFIRRLLRDLEAIPGVEKALGPEDAPDSLVEHDLPPRRDASLVILGTNPIVKNAPVTRDDQFYGRERELREFKSRTTKLVFDGVNAQFGELVLLSGALQSGKTSFVLRSLREMHRERDRLMLEVYLEARENERWSALERRILQALSDKVAQLAIPWRRPSLSLDGFDLVSAAQAVIEWTKGGALIIAVDEILRLVDATSASDEESERMRRVVLSLRAIPRCMVVLSGPAARVRPVHPALAELLDKCQSIRLAHFSHSDIKKLLVAEKLPWTQKATTDARVVNRVFELTNGDPLWVGCLIHQLWEFALASGTAHRARFLDPADVDLATDRLMSDESCFEVRLRFLKGDGLSHGRESLSVLKLLSDGSPSPQSVDELAAQSEIARSIVEIAVGRLEQAGLAKTILGTGEKRYAIAAPILAGYMQRRGVAQQV